MAHFCCLHLLLSQLQYTAAILPTMNCCKPLLVYLRQFLPHLSAAQTAMSKAAYQTKLLRDPVWY